MDDYRMAFCILFGSQVDYGKDISIKKISSIELIFFCAEVEGFEPPVPFLTLQFSRLVHSTTLPYLQV